ncbi:hypothetical protein VTH06DRAFT_2710 [Thermothelomyces fergusii]
MMTMICRYVDRAEICFISCPLSFSSTSKVFSAVSRPRQVNTGTSLLSRALPSFLLDNAALVCLIPLKVQVVEIGRVG